MLIRSSLCFVLLALIHTGKSQDISLAADESCGTPSSKVLLCYYSGVEPLATIDPCLCSHLVVSGSIISENGKLVISSDDLASITLLRERNPALQVIASVGSKYVTKSNFTSLTTSDKIRKTFVESVVDYVENGDLNGIEIDWEWPAEFGNGKQQRQELTHLTKELFAFFRENTILKREERSVDGNASSSDTANQTTLNPVSDVVSVYEPSTTETIAEVLNLAILEPVLPSTTPVTSVPVAKVGTQNPLIILRLPVVPELLVKGFDLKALTRSVDLFVVSTHNITSEDLSSNYTYHHSRLMGEGDIQNVDSVLDLLISLGVPVEKIVPAIPTFGGYFRLKNETESTSYSPAVSRPAVLTFRQICSILRNGNWIVEREDDLTGAYVYREDQWIAFDDDITAKVKAKYLLLRGVPGAAVFYVDTDDTQGTCGKSKYPVIKAIKDTFNSLSRLRRKAVLGSLEEDLVTSATDARPVYFNNVRLSPYRIVRVVDRSGYSKVHREATETTLRCSRQGYYRHPENCNYFYRCVKFNQYTDDFTVFEYQCPEGLVFDEKWEVCTWPSQTASCGGSSEIQPVPQTKFICPGEGYFADPENCRWFFACKDYSGAGELTQYEFRCPFGLVFDAPNLICNWPWLVEGCGSGSYKNSYSGSYQPSDRPYTTVKPYTPAYAGAAVPPAIIYKPGQPTIVRKEPGSPGYLLGKVISSTGQTAYDVSTCTDCKSPDLKVNNEGAVATASSTVVEDTSNPNGAAAVGYNKQSYNPAYVVDTYAGPAYPSQDTKAYPGSLSYGQPANYSSSYQPVRYNKPPTLSYGSSTYLKPSANGEAYPAAQSSPYNDHDQAAPVKPSHSGRPGFYGAASYSNPAPTHTGSYPAPLAYTGSYPQAPAYQGSRPQGASYPSPSYKPPASSGSTPQSPSYTQSYPQAPSYSQSYPSAPAYSQPNQANSNQYQSSAEYSQSYPKATASSGSYPEPASYSKTSAYPEPYPNVPAYSDSYPKTPSHSGYNPVTSDYSESLRGFPTHAESHSKPAAGVKSNSYPSTYPKAPAYSDSYPIAPTYVEAYPKDPAYQGSYPAAPAYQGSYPAAVEYKGSYQAGSQPGAHSSGKPPANVEKSQKYPEVPYTSNTYKSGAETNVYPVHGGSGTNYKAPGYNGYTAASPHVPKPSHIAGSYNAASNGTTSQHHQGDYKPEGTSKVSATESSRQKPKQNDEGSDTKAAKYPQKDYKPEVPPKPQSSDPSYKKPAKHGSYVPVGQGHSDYMSPTYGDDAPAENPAYSTPVYPASPSYTPSYKAPEYSSPSSNQYPEKTPPPSVAYGKPIGSYSTSDSAANVQESTEEGQKVVSIKVPTPVRPAVLKKFTEKRPVSLPVEAPAAGNSEGFESEEPEFGQKDSSRSDASTRVQTASKDAGSQKKHSKVRPHGPAKEAVSHRSSDTPVANDPSTVPVSYQEDKLTLSKASVPYHDRHRGSAASHRRPVVGGAFGFKPLNETLPVSMCSRPGLFRHPEDCRKFFECYYDRWITKYTLHVFSCPVKLVYDEELYACNWPFQGPQCVPNQPLDEYEDNQPFVSEVSV